MTFRYTDPDGDSIEADPSLNPDSITITVTRPHDGQPATARIPLDRVEEVIAGIRDTARQAAQEQR